MFISMAFQALTVVLCLTFTSIHGFLLDQNADHGRPVVNTSCGPVHGLWLNKAFSFRGIPFAKPPTGQLRWKPPQPLSQADGSCWSGTYEARTFGNSCFQRFNNSALVGSEDCLFLNVWTPSVNRSAKLPVIVRIHGGGLQSGSGHKFPENPDETLASKTGVVYVTMNYRLHVFGFMALQILADDSPTKTSGNYGFMDQILALQWVQDNILNFGGDPAQVTLAGESSGGTSVFALLGSPLCKGLFHRGWLMSASPILNKTASEAFRDNLVFLHNTPCRNVSCLRQMSAEDLTGAVPWNTYPYWDMPDAIDLPVSGLFDGAIAIVDGDVLPESPFDAWGHGNAMDVPLLVGTTGQEVDIFPTPGDIASWSWQRYEEALRAKLGTFDNFTVNIALKLYPPGNMSPEYQYTSMVSDVRVTCGNDYLALVASTFFKSPVYRYVTTYIPSQPIDLGFDNPARNAFHGLDLLGAIGTLASVVSKPTSADKNFEDNIQAEKLSFIKTGRPATASWGVYPGATALLSQTTTTTDAYHRAQCMFWSSNGFVSYSWVN